MKMQMSSRWLWVLWVVLAGMIVSSAAGADEPLGRLIWARSSGSPERDSATGVVPLSDGSYLVAGWYETVFDSKLSNESQPPYLGFRDIFTAKYSRDGVLSWVKMAGSRDCDLPLAISALSDGTFAMTGLYGYGGSTATFGINEPNQIRLQGKDHYEAFFSKYNANGTLQWVRRCGGEEFDEGTDVAIAPDGSCYGAGDFSATAVFGDENPATQVSLTVDEMGCFLVRYDAAGQFQWVKQYDYPAVLKLAALPDNTCMVTGDNELQHYGLDGTLLWRDDTLIPLEVAAIPGSSAFLAVGTSPQGCVLRKYTVAPDGSAAMNWETVLSTFCFTPLISIRQDGVAFVYVNGGMFFRVRPDGSIACQSTVSIYPEAFCALEGVERCMMVGSYYDDTLFGAGEPTETTLASMGSGDRFYAQVTSDAYVFLNLAYEGNGSVMLDPPGGYYPEGTSVTLEASPTFPSHDQFSEWGGDLASNGSINPVIITMPAEDVQAVARFSEIAGANELPALTVPGLGLLGAVLAAGGMRMMRRRK